MSTGYRKEEDLSGGRQFSNGRRKKVSFYTPRIMEELWKYWCVHIYPEMEKLLYEKFQLQRGGTRCNPPSLSADKSKQALLTWLIAAVVKAS